MTLPKPPSNWPSAVTALLGVGAVLFSIIATATASSKTDMDHERRIILLEQKFERMMEKQGEMVGDIKVIRAYIETTMEKKPNQ